MHYKPSKTSPTPTGRIWEKFWMCSLEITWSLSQWLQRNTNSNDWSSIRQTRDKWISRRTPETSKKRIRSFRSGFYRAIHICENASPPEKINQPGAYGEWHLRTDCVASWKGIRIEWFGSPRWNAAKYGDATCHTEHRNAQTNLTPLQKARSLLQKAKSVPSTQARKRPNPK